MGISNNSPVTKTPEQTLYQASASFDDSGGYCFSRILFIFALSGQILAEFMGVRYDREKQCFVFDFEHDGAEDIFSLIGRRDLMADITAQASSQNEYPCSFLCVD